MTTTITPESESCNLLIVIFASVGDSRLQFGLKVSAAYNAPRFGIVYKTSELGGLA